MYRMYFKGDVIEMYRVRFRPYGKEQGFKNELSCHRVYSMDKNEILLFMKQHHFETENPIIETLPDDFDDDDMDLHMLSLYIMRSNRTRQIHQVYTTNFYINEAVEMVVKCLSDYLVFGETVFRRDIPFIKYANDLLDDIPFVFAFDFDMLDGGPACDTSYFCVKKDLQQFEESIDTEYDTSSLDDLYNRFMFNIVPGKPLPITLEAYIRYFVKNVIKKA